MHDNTIFPYCTQASHASSFALQSLSPRGVVTVVGDEGEILVLLFFFIHCFAFDNAF